MGQCKTTRKQLCFFYSVKHSLRKNSENKSSFDQIAKERHLFVKVGLKTQKSLKWSLLFRILNTYNLFEQSLEGLARTGLYLWKISLRLLSLLTNLLQWDVQDTHILSGLPFFPHKDPNRSIPAATSTILVVLFQTLLVSPWKITQNNLKRISTTSCWTTPNALQDSHKVAKHAERRRR